jgi:predicted RNA-binding protein
MGTSTCDIKRFVQMQAWLRIYIVKFFSSCKFTEKFIECIFIKTSENYFDSHREFTVILCIEAYLDRGYFWELFQLPPAIIYENK